LACGALKGELINLCCGVVVVVGLLVLDCALEGLCVTWNGRTLPGLMEVDIRGSFLANVKQ